MDKNHAQRHQTAITQLIDLYEKIEELLSRLPLRIEVPLLQGEVYRAEVRAGLVQAVTVVGDLPMDGEARQVVREVIGDWLIAMEFLFRDEEDEAGWHSGRRPDPAASHRHRDPGQYGAVRRTHRPDLTGQPRATRSWCALPRRP